MKEIKLPVAAHLILRCSLSRSRLVMCSCAKSSRMGLALMVLRGCFSGDSASVMFLCSLLSSEGGRMTNRLVSSCCACNACCGEGETGIKKKLFFLLILPQIYNQLCSTCEIFQVPAWCWWRVGASHPTIPL